MKPLSATLLVTLLGVVGCEEKPADTTAGAPAPTTGAPVPAPASAPQNLFERLGGQDGLSTMVEALLVNIGHDGRINTYFNNLDQTRFRTYMVAFLCGKTGGSCAYTGREIKEVHKSMQITPEDFEAMLEVTGKTLNEKGVAEADKKELLEIMASYKGDIVSTGTR
jgi:hemoglobin